MLVGRERLLRRGARLVERLLSRVDDVVLRGALLLELLASLFGAHDLRVDLGLRDLALREQRAHALTRRVERRRNRCALDLAETHFSEHAQAADLRLLEALELGRRARKPCVDGTDLTARVAQRAFDQSQYIIAGQRHRLTTP